MSNILLFGWKEGRPSWLTLNLETGGGISEIQIEKESAIWLFKPGIWAAWKKKLSMTDKQVRRLTNLLINWTDDRPLLIILTVASLSQKNKICFLDHCLPHRIPAINMGYNSNRAVDMLLSGTDSSSFGHLLANHWPLTPPQKKPTEGAASVYKLRAAEDSKSS